MSETPRPKFRVGTDVLSHKKDESELRFVPMFSHYTPGEGWTYRGTTGMWWPEDNLTRVPTSQDEYTEAKLWAQHEITRMMYGEK